MAIPKKYRVFGCLGFGYPEVPYGAYIPTLVTPFIGNAPGVWEDMRPPNRSCWRLSNDDYTSGAPPLKMPLKNFPVWNFFWFTWVEGSKDQNPAVEVDSHAKPLNFILFEGFQKGEPKRNTYSKRSNISPKAISLQHFFCLFKGSNHSVRPLEAIQLDIYFWPKKMCRATLNRSRKHRMVP